MKQVGGFFTYEALPQKENNFFQTRCPSGGEFKFFMSGRCANYYVLKEISLNDKKKVAYVPVYTCETVLAPFVKAGYQLLFYGISKEMVPQFDDSVLDRISVINLCGYYGFCQYDRDFIRRCSERGIIILQDATHSVFSEDGIDPHCSYVVGSMRKWIGVSAGGFAVKTKGTFVLPVKEPDHDHLAQREETMVLKAEYSSKFSDQPIPAEYMERLNSSFWNAEMKLRSIYDSFGSDPVSDRILTHYDFSAMIQRRRENYLCLLRKFPVSDHVSPVFSNLPPETVPSHFTVYAKNRTQVQEYLAGVGIKTTVYWPVGPMVDLTGQETAIFIYDHVLSIPCDQRYGEGDMEYICEKLGDIPEY